MKQLAAKLLAVMRECSYVEKNGTNDFHGYKYATSADVLAKVNSALVKHGIASVAHPELIDMIDVITARGNTEKLATVQMTITLIDTENGDTFEISGIGSGQDAGDKAVMKAETAAIKYAYMLSLAISTGDDPEADENTDKAVSQEQPKRQVIKENDSGKPRTVAKAGYSTCSDCGATISQKVAEYSEKRFGRKLCMRCQHQARESA